MHQTICVSYCSSLPANVTPGPAQRERAHCVTHTEPGLQPCMQWPAALWPSPSPSPSHPQSPTVTHGHHSLSVPHGWAGAGVVALASPCWCWRLLVLVCGDQLSVQCPASASQRSYSDICCPCAVPVCPPCTATLRHYLPCCDVTPVSLSSVQCPHCPLPDTADP